LAIESCWPQQDRHATLSGAKGSKMSNKKSDNVRRTVQIKFTLTGADPSHLLALAKSAAPFLEMFGPTKIRLLQNVDDKSRFVQLVEYEAPKSMEQNRQRFASDPRFQTYMQTWRTFLPGAAEIDVFEEIEG
jgi:hypothetical protein